jgi:hypothetical protein
MYGFPTPYIIIAIIIIIISVRNGAGYMGYLN